MQVHSDDKRPRSGSTTEEQLHLLLGALRAVERGDSSVRLPELAANAGDGAPGVLDEIARAFNAVVGQKETLARELTVHKDELRGANTRLERQALELAEKTAQLAFISKYKAEFLANMSHELRTPLNSLLILAKLLAENNEGNLTEKQIECARTVHASGVDLLALINRILDLSEVEAGRMLVEPHEIPLSAVRDFVEQSFRAVADAKGLGLEVELFTRAPATIVTDPHRLQQVLKNLLGNAFKFTDHGRVALRIDLAPRQERFTSPLLDAAAEVISFAVADTGIGIHRDKHELIFEAFQQADGTSSRKYGGAGLGLSLSNEITRLLGGEIQVTSVPGQGSTFTLYLPQSRAWRPPDGT